MIFSKIVTVIVNTIVLFDCDWVMLRCIRSFVTVIVIRDYCLVVDYLCSGRTESRRSWRSLQLDDSFRFSHTCVVNTLYGWYSLSKSGLLLVFTRSNLSMIFWSQQTSFVSRKNLGRQWSSSNSYMLKSNLTEVWVWLHTENWVLVICRTKSSFNSLDVWQTRT